jgi:proton glutamate symport protein
VPDSSRDQFSTWAGIRSRGVTRIAIPNLPYYIEKMRERLPEAELRVVPDVTHMFEDPHLDVDAIAMTAERGSAWTLLYPRFSVVVPEPGHVKVPLAYPIGRHDQAFASFINTWIELKRKDGTIDTLYEHWVLGRDAAPPRPRWSIIRNVLHWVD